MAEFARIGLTNDLSVVLIECVGKTIRTQLNTAFQLTHIEYPQTSSTAHKTYIHWTTSGKLRSIFLRGNYPSHGRPLSVV